MRASQASLCAIWLAGFIGVVGCSRQVILYPTWASRKELPPPKKVFIPASLPPAGTLPWAGTTSHHLLADSLIDAWFAQIASRRRVELFYLLSPSHWGLGVEPYSLTEGSWKVPGGQVDSDRYEVRRLANVLGVGLEPAVFIPEHGVSTLMPYIARYFPGAKVVAIVYRGEPPLNEPRAARLLKALASGFSDRGKERNFLIISTDFAHHGNLAGTIKKDQRTELFFDAPTKESWIFAGCDNRPGVYCVGNLVGKKTGCSILFHSDSLALSGQGADDITSYFFTMFWDSRS